MRDFDVIVIGGGSAGTAAAAAAARVGARTLMVNDGELGGLCILRGCMPSKAMLASAHAAHEATRTEPFGVRRDGRVVADFVRIMARKDSQVRRFQRAKIASVEGSDYEVVFGRARFVDDAAVAVGARRLRARAYVIATGSRPVRPVLPGIEQVPVLTSDDVMALTEQPAALLVLGAGPIGLELGQFFARIGTRVLLVGRSDLLSRHDAECGEELRRSLAEEPNLELAVPATIEGLRPVAGGVEARVAGARRERTYRADAVLLATGRRPALDDLGLEHLGLVLRGGRLEHDAHMRTGRPNVFAAGDATGRNSILHLANQEGTVAGHNAGGGSPARSMSYRLAMTAIFTDPPFASVGLSQARAERRGLAPLVGRARFAQTGRAITLGVEHGLWKLVVAPHTGEVLGSSILGPRADDLAHVVATLMHFRGGVDEICALPWYHPTLSEVMLNLARDVCVQLRRSVDAPGAATLPPGYSSMMREESEAR